METYASPEEYLCLYPDGTAPQELLPGLLAAASRDVDGLTFNRIVRAGFANLTPFQQELVKRAVYEQAQFRHTYGDLLSSPFSAYSINGVSMQFNGQGVVERSGVKAPAHVLALLRQTGLACTRLDGR